MEKNETPYTHTLDIAFEVHTDIDKAEDLPGKVVLLGLLQRITTMLEKNCHRTIATGQFCVGEAVGHCVTHYRQCCIEECVERVEGKDCRLEGRFNG